MRIPFADGKGGTWSPGFVTAHWGRVRLFRGMFVVAVLMAAGDGVGLVGGLLKIPFVYCL
jgi:hypothetical protein